MQGGNPAPDLPVDIPQIRTDDMQRATVLGVQRNRSLPGGGPRARCLPQLRLLVF
jgi:hypothetical protein